MMKKELLFSVTKKDLKVDWFSGTGAGGQYRNKHQNCIRIHHRESGAMVIGQSNRDRMSNQKEAIRNLIKDPRFKMWHARKCYEAMSGKTIEQRVDELMQEHNLKVETKNDKGLWEVLDND